MGDNCELKQVILLTVFWLQEDFVGVSDMLYKAHLKEALFKAEVAPRSHVKYVVYKHIYIYINKIKMYIYIYIYVQTYIQIFYIYIFIYIYIYIYIYMYMYI